MRIDSVRPTDIVAWILVLCALLTTGLVVRREIAQDSMATAVADTQREAIYVDGWQEALTVGIRSGSANAPVQVVEFADFQCPYCARFEATFQTVRDKYPHQVAFTFAHLPLSYHEFAESAARVAECAHNQERFEAMRSLLFEKQSTYGSVPWANFAKQAAIPDGKRFDACVNDTAPLVRVEQGKKLAEKLGVRGTPTIIVNGWKLPVPPSSEDFDRILKNVLDGKPPAADIDFRR